MKIAWFAHEQNCNIFREELPYTLTQRPDKLVKIKFFVVLTSIASLVEAPCSYRLLCWQMVAIYAKSYSGQDES